MDQLRFARDEAGKLIKEKEDGEKIIIWVVEDLFINDSCYLDSDFDKAKKRLAELILNDDFQRIHVSREHPKIIKRKVFECELPSWMELNK